MKRTTVEPLSCLILMIVAGSALRLYFQDLPNFAPVAGLALFAGFYFRQMALAAAAPLGVMVITDQLLGGYQPLLMLTVYSMLTLPVLLRGWLRRSVAHLETQRSGRSLASLTAGLLASSFACSVAFFVATNFVTWLVTPWYPRTAAGLLNCFVNAIPFFRYTLAGDLTTMSALFSVYFALQWRRAELPQATTS